MGSYSDQVPRGRYADERWKSLGWGRRSALVRGQEPHDQEEAFTALGYGRRMVRRAELFALLSALGAFVVYTGIALLVESTITTQTLIFAAGTGVGVGVAMELVGRWQGRRLARNAEKLLSE